MPWKTRGGRSYYYRSERSGGRVVSTYVGSGETADLIAKLDELERIKRIGVRDREHLTARREAKRTIRLERACLALTLAAEGLIEAAGYHRYHRGPWRRRRTMSDATTLATVPAPSTAKALGERYKAGDKDAWPEIKALIDKAQKGDTDAASQVRSIVRACPSVADWLVLDIAKVAENALIRRICGKDNLASVEAACHKVGALREELAGPNPSAVERLLAERVALCRLDCYMADFYDIESNGTIRQAEFSMRRRDHADRRYVSALKALAAVRKLPIVAVQVNVGTDPAPEPRS